MPLTGYAVFFGESLISWITWVLQLLKDLKIDHSRPAMLFCDN